MTMEDALREAAAKGLTHLSLWPVESEDKKTTYWTARATPSTMHSFVQVHDTDPVKAMAGVLANLPKAAKRDRKKVTAKVTEPSDLAGQPEPSDLAGQPETMDTWLPK